MIVKYHRLRRPTPALRAAQRYLSFNRPAAPVTVWSRVTDMNTFSAGFGQFMPKRAMSGGADVVEMKCPNMGDSITEGTISEWRVAPGESFQTDDILCVIETDKVAVEIPAPSSGVLETQFAEVDSTILVGDPLLKFTATGDENINQSDSESEDAAPAASQQAAASATASAGGFQASGAPKTEAVPTMGDSIVEGNLNEWRVKVGESFRADDVIACIETDKVVIDVIAPEDGVLDKTFADEGKTVSVGDNLYTYTPGSGGAPAAAPAAEAAAPAAPAAAAPTATPAAPKKEEPKAAPAAPAAAAAAPVQFGGSREERRVPMTRMRKRISERLKQSQNTTAMLTTFNEIDMTNIMALRSQYKDEFQKKHDMKLGFMSAFVKSAAVALTNEPNVNAAIDGEDIVYRDFIDISVAVAAPNGLVVPVLRNCENKSFFQIESEIADFGKRAKSGQLALEEMAGGTFTISNGGVFGSLFGTPIINPPQSAILGMHATKPRAVVVDGQVVARPMMYVALTYDHRLIDGREAVTFLKTIKECVEDPRRILLDL